MKKERIILGLAAALALVSTLYFRLPITAGLLFILIEAGGTFCVGRLILRAMKVDEGLRGADTLALSFALGYGASLLLYVALFLLAPHGAIAPVYLAVSVAALAWAVFSWKRGDELVAADDSRSLALTFLAILLAIYTFTFMLPNFLPIEETNSYYLDNLFWIGNNVELTLAIPPDNFRNVLADNLSYHYLSSVRMAFIQTTLDIPAFEACFAYSFFDVSMLLSSSAVMFVAEFAGDGREGRIPIFIAVFFLLFSTGFERLTSMSFLSHLFIASFGFGESFSAMLVFLALLKRFWERGELCVGEAVTAAIMLALCMGHKGTLGFVCLVVTFVVCAASLARKGLRKFALLFGLLSLAAGLAVYFLLLSKGLMRNTGNVSNVRDLMSFPRIKELYQALRSLPLPRIIPEVLFLAAYFFLSHPLCCIAAAVALFQSIRRRSFDALDAGIIISALVCAAVLRLVPMRGFSQSYFFMAAVPLMWGYAFKNLRLPDAVLAPRIQVAALACTVALSLGFCYQGWIPKLVMKDAAHVAGMPVPDEMITMSGFSTNIITPQAYGALIWVRDNLAEDVLVTTDVYDGSPKNLYYPGAVAERHVITQGNLRVNLGLDPDQPPSIFSGDPGMLGHLRAASIRYLIQIEDTKQLETLLPGNLEVVYRQDDATVYAVIE